jgi:hypothetical protein
MVMMSSNESITLGTPAQSGHIIKTNIFEMYGDRLIITNNFILIIIGFNGQLPLDDFIDSSC